MSGAEKI